MVEEMTKVKKIAKKLSPMLWIGEKNGQRVWSGHEYCRGRTKTFLMWLWSVKMVIRWKDTKLSWPHPAHSSKICWWRTNIPTLWSTWEGCRPPCRTLCPWWRVVVLWTPHSDVGVAIVGDAVLVNVAGRHHTGDEQVPGTNSKVVVRQPHLKWFNGY